MKSVELTGQKTLEIKDTEVPALEPGEVLIKVAACGVCGSDLHYWEAGLGMDGKPNLVMGHEFCGTIEDAGDAKGFKPGERVTVIPMDSCGECPPCKAGVPALCFYSATRKVPGNTSSGKGGYAEYAPARADMVRKIPDSISDLEGAMIEPASVAMHSVNVAEVKKGDKVLVIGGGPIGMLSAKCAKIMGASYVALTETNPYRISVAEKVKEIDQVANALEKGFMKELKKATGGGFNAVIDTSGVDAGLNSGLSALLWQGRMVITGISFKPQQVNTIAVVVKELTIKGVYGYLPEEFEKVIDLIANKKLTVSDMDLKTINLDGIPAAFEELISGKADVMKYIIQP